MQLEELLRNFGPMTTSRASQMLQEHGLSPVAARQRISRKNDSVGRLFGLSFPKRARFIYLDSEFGSDRYWDALTDAIEDSNPAYSASLNGLRARGQVSLRDHFDMFCGSPGKQKKQIASWVVLKRLIDVKLIEEFEVEGFGSCIAFARSAARSSSRINVMRARLLTEGVLLDAIRAWAVRMNLASPGVTTIRGANPPPNFSTFRFDLSGPCYLQPMVQRSAESVLPGFLCADVLLGVELDEKLVQPFIRKCTMLSKVRNARPFLPMLIGDSFTANALNACRNRGIIATTPETMFGQSVARGLTDLLQTLSQSATATESQIENLFKKLSVIEGAAGNLRGALFELVVGHCIRAVRGGTVDIGVIVNSDQGKRAEIDVQHVAEKTVTVYECEGYQPDSLVGLDEVTKWIEVKVPVIYAALKAQERFSASTISFEFWTCGGFHPDALEVLSTARSSIKRYSVDWKDGAAVQTYSQSLSAPGIKKILNDHYFKHPLASVRSLSAKTRDDVAVENGAAVRVSDEQ